MHPQRKYGNGNLPAVRTSSTDAISLSRWTYTENRKERSWENDEVPDQLSNTIPDDAIFVIDGGYLLHAVVWPKRSTYQAACEAYKTYIIKHYHQGATVVFDGYAGPPSTKSAEQNRRVKIFISADIVIAPNLPTTTIQAALHGINCNKARLY